MNFWDYFQAIVIICAVILGAYYVTKLVAKTGGGAFRRGSSIRQVASLSLGRDKSVTIVEIGDMAYILGVSQQRVDLLDKLSMAELNKTGIKTDSGTAGLISPVPGGTEQGDTAQGRTLPSFGESFKEELKKRLNINRPGE
jgi:flagellar biosynthetic protein FliO